MKKMNNPIGLGTAAIGRPSYINLKPTREQQGEFSLAAFRQQGMVILEAAYEQGVRYFDTAPGYGMAEQLLIDWTREKADASIEVATKWGYTYVANFDPQAVEHEVKEHSLSKLNEQWETSKALLPLVTTYQIHSATFETGVLENEAVLHRLQALKQEHGLLIGITTTGAQQTEVLKRVVDVELGGVQLFDAFQVTYNVFDQSLGSVAAELASQHKCLIIKEALANGRVFPNENYAHYTATYQLLSQLSEKYVVGIDAIALRFCVQSIPAFKVLSGAANAQHLRDNLQAATFSLEQEDIDNLQRLAIAPAAYWQERKQLGWS